MSGSITIQSSTVTGISGSKIIGPLVLSGANPVAEILDVAISGAGSTTITSPAGATWAVIVAPTGNASTITLKGIAGDTGIPSQASGVVALISFASPALANSFVLTTNGAVSGGVEISFF